MVRSLDLKSGGLGFKSSTLLPTGFVLGHSELSSFKDFIFIWRICFSLFPGPQCKLLGPPVIVKAIRVYLFSFIYLSVLSPFKVS